MASAIAEYEQLLNDRLRVLGPHHPNTSEVCLWLADLRDENGDPKANALNELLAACLRVHGPDHPDTIMTRANIVNVHNAAGDPARAAAACEDCSLPVCGYFALTTPTPSAPATISRMQAGQAVMEGRLPLAMQINFVREEVLRRLGRRSEWIACRLDRCASYACQIPNYLRQAAKRSPWA